MWREVRRCFLLLLFLLPLVFLHEPGFDVLGSVAGQFGPHDEGIMAGYCPAGLGGALHCISLRQYNVPLGSSMMIQEKGG